MSSSSFAGLYIASSGLFASQTALNVVSHNIANANRAGYTRQRLNLESSTPIKMPTLGMLGTGVDQKSIVQIRDKFLDFKYRKETPLLGEWSAKSQILKSVDAIFNEPSSTNSGIQSVMDEFYKSLEELSKKDRVDELTTRVSVRQSAIMLAKNINTMSGKLEALQDDLDFELKTKIEQINSYGRQIRDVNEMIFRQEADGVSVANDMRDKRNLLVDELSQIAKIDYYENSDGEFTVMLENRPLVSHYSNYDLQLIPREGQNNYVDAPGLYEVAWADTERTAQYKGEGAIDDPLTADLVGKFTINNTEISLNIPNGTSAANVATQITTALHAKGLTDISASVEGGRLKFTNSVVGPKSTIDISGMDMDLQNALGMTPGSAIGVVLLEPTSGSLKGVLDMRDNISGSDKGIPYYLDKLNTFADTLMTELNEIHSTGYGLDSSTGTYFFTINGMSTDEYEDHLKTTGIKLTTGTIPAWDDSKTEEENNRAINDAIKLELKNHPEGKTIKRLRDGEYYVVDKMNASEVTLCSDLNGDEGLNRMAASATIADLPGDTQNALKLADSKHTEDMFDWGSPDDFVKSLVSNLGVDGQEATRMMDNQTVVINQIEMNRKSISGVSLDEEMTNMIKFQHAFNASSRMITVIDEMLDKVINGLGVAGR